MATVPSTAGAAASVPAMVTVTEGGSPVKQNKTRKTRTKQLPVTKRTNKQCCFNEPGGPWPQYVTTSTIYTMIIFIDCYSATSCSRLPPALI